MGQILNENLNVRTPESLARFSKPLLDNVCVVCLPRVGLSDREEKKEVFESFRDAVKVERVEEGGFALNVLNKADSFGAYSSI